MVNNQKQVSAVFAALADSTRRQILMSLSNKQESRVTALAQPFRMSAPAISKHLRVLERAKLIDRRREGRTHLIRARAAGIKEAQKWINQWVAGWEFSFDRLDDLISKEMRKGKKP